MVSGTENSKVKADAASPIAVNTPGHRVTPVETDQTTPTKEFSNTPTELRQPKDLLKALPKEARSSTVQEQIKSVSAKAASDQSKNREDLPKPKTVAFDWGEGIGLVAEDDTLSRYTNDPFFDNLIASFVK